MRFIELHEKVLEHVSVFAADCTSRPRRVGGGLSVFTELATAKITQPGEWLSFKERGTRRRAAFSEKVNKISEDSILGWNRVRA
jgi:hypothetical protein